MNADHDLDESTVTEMSQVISALIQRGNCFNMVKMMYEDIGRVALEAIDKIKAANESDNNNDIFEAIGHALIDTFNAGNKNTIGLKQAFVSRFEQLIKSGKMQNLLYRLARKQLLLRFLLQLEQCLISEELNVNMLDWVAINVLHIMLCVIIITADRTWIMKKYAISLELKWINQVAN